jgi:hypothetical protein
VAQRIFLKHGQKFYPNKLIKEKFDKLVQEPSKEKTKAYSPDIIWSKRFAPTITHKRISLLILTNKTKGVRHMLIVKHMHIAFTPNFSIN